MSENLRGKASVAFSLSLSGSSSGDVAATLKGHTRDMRATGLSLVVPRLRIGGEEMVAADRRLRVVLELPSGPLEMEVAPVRYEPLEAEEGYLIGVRITEISDSDCVRFVKYLRALR